VLAVLVLLALDFAIGEELLLAPMYATGALIAAYAAGARLTLLVAVLAFAASFGALAFQTDLAYSQDGIRLLTVAVTGGFAVWIGYLRDRLLVQAARQRYLATASEALVGAAGQQEMLQGFVNAAVPTFADWCALDLVDDDRRIERVAVATAPGTPRPDAEPVRIDDRQGVGRVIRTGEAEAGVPSARMTLPLTVRTRTLGALSLGRTGGARRFRAADAQTGEELARRCALMLDNARLLEEMRDTQRRLLDAFGLLDVIFERAPIGLAFFDRDLRYLRLNDRLAEINGVPAAQHLGRRTSEVLPDLDPAVEGDLRRVFENGTPLIDVDVRGATPADPGRPREFLVSYFPVRRGGIDVIGIGAVVLDVTDRRAAERALRAQTDRYETLLLALSEVGEGMVVLQDEHVIYANQAFQTMTGYGFDELRAMESVLALVEPGEREEARRRAGLRMDEGTVDPHYQLRVRHRDGRTLDLEVAGVPLEIEGTRQLVIVVRDVTARRRAEAERERLLAAERESRGAAELAHRRARFLAESSVAFEQSLDVARTTEIAARLAVQEGPATCVVLLAPAGEVGHVAAVAAADAAVAERLRALLASRPVEDRASEHPLLATVRTGRAMVLADLERDGIPDPVGEGDAHGQPIDTRALITVPLRARDRTLGAVALGYAQPLGDDQVRDQLGLFEDFAARAALALDNARLYEDRTHVARTLQRSLLPTELPDIPGVELAARYLAAGEGNEVGGDFYDGFALGGREWALVIGDVCGKGAEAAAITALARYTTRAAVLHTRRPSRILAELNEALLRQQVDYRFCTVAFAGLQPLSSGAFAVRLAAGGHPLPLVLRADGAVEYAGTPGTLLGIVPDPDLPEREIVLEPGDTIVLYTDGVIEASPVDDALGPEAFAAFVATLAGSDAATLAAAIERAVLDVQGGGLRDDVALLVLRVAPR
jgi:PAS domain S-box-containing protein